MLSGLKGPVVDELFVTFREEEEGGGGGGDGILGPSPLGLFKAKSKLEGIGGGRKGEVDDSSSASSSSFRALIESKKGFGGRWSG